MCIYGLSYGMNNHSRLPRTPTVTLEHVGIHTIYIYKYIYIYSPKSPYELVAFRNLKEHRIWLDLAERGLLDDPL